MKMENEYHDPFPPVFIDALGEAYYQQSYVDKHLISNVRNISPPLFSRLATEEEIPILKDLGMTIGHVGSRLCVRLIKVNDVKNFLERKHGRVKRKFTPSRKFLQSVESGTVMAIREVSNVQLPNLRVNRMVRMKEPPFSTVKLVGQALLSSENIGLTSREIITWIARTYPYFQSINCYGRISTALSTSKFFAKNSMSPRQWCVVAKYEATLKEFAYLPNIRKRGRPRREDREEMSAISAVTEEPLSPETIFIDEDEASETIAESVDEVETLTESAPSYSLNGEAIQIISEQECQPSRPDASSIAVRQEQPHLAVTEVAASVSQEIKPEILDTVNLVENDESDFKDQSVGLTQQIECKVNPISFPTVIDTIDLTSDEIDFQCPICDAHFWTKEALGEHVLTHKKAQPNSDATRTASEAMRNLTSSLLGSNSESFQKMTSSLFGGNRESPIFVFSGNVYFTSSPNTPTTS